MRASSPRAAPRSRSSTARFRAGAQGDARALTRLLWIVVGSPRRRRRRSESTELPCAFLPKPLTLRSECGPMRGRRNRQRAAHFDCDRPILRSPAGRNHEVFSGARSELALHHGSDRHVRPSQAGCSIRPMHRHRRRGGSTPARRVCCPARRAQAYRVPKLGWEPARGVAHGERFACTVFRFRRREA